MIRILILIGVTCLMFGCQPANKPPANQSAPPDNMPRTERVKQTAPDPNHSRNPQKVAQRMVKIATNMPQVEGATAVAAGGYTIVGIDVDPALDRGRVGTIKYSVAEALKEDPQGANALVTADTDLVQRLRELSDAARNGRPISGIAEELGEIANRIMPQPSKQVPRNEEPQTQTNQEKLNQNKR